jgi:hypothetical protein
VKATILQKRREHYLLYSSNQNDAGDSAGQPLDCVPYTAKQGLRAECEYVQNPSEALYRYKQEEMIEFSKHVDWHLSPDASLAPSTHVFGRVVRARAPGRVVRTHALGRKVRPARELS